jgi:hypothetical protein
VVGSNRSLYEVLFVAFLHHKNAKTTKTNIREVVMNVMSHKWWEELPVKLAMWVFEYSVAMAPLVFEA